VDLLVQHSGVGEARLLRPALSATGRRPVAFVQPPHTPDGLGLSYIGLTLEQMLRVKAPKTADALWSVEQILRAGSCGALVFWTQYAQASSLRRLHLAAQSSETLFIMVRPPVAAQDASPALLRLALKPSSEGLTVDIVKRRGPSCTEPLAIVLQPTPVLLSRHARLSRQSAVEVATRSHRKEVLV
jgi:hypothetical protein